MTASKKLTMRYQTGNAFTFSKLKPNARNVEMLNLAEAFAYLQTEKPARITATTSRQII